FFTVTSTPGFAFSNSAAAVSRGSAPGPVSHAATRISPSPPVSAPPQPVAASSSVADRARGISAPFDLLMAAFPPRFLPGFLAGRGGGGGRRRPPSGRGGRRRAADRSRGRRPG